MSTNARPLSPRATPIQGSRIAGPGFGQNTLEFFEEGERQESENQEEVLVPTEEEPVKVSLSPSFDKVPREKSAIILLVLISGLLLAGIVLGVRAWVRTGRNVNASAHSMTNQPLTATTAPAIVPIITILPTPPPLANPLVAQPTTDETTPSETIENANDDERDRLDRNADEDAIDLQLVEKRVSPGPLARQIAKVKVERRKSPRFADDLNQETRPATSASVVDRPLLKNMAQIEPPRIIAPPSELPVPEGTSDVDPFEP